MCILKVKLGNGSSGGVVRVYNAESDDWEEVCSDDWNDTLSELVCRQLGYRYYNMWSRRHWRCLFSFYCLFSEDLNLPVHIFKENVLSTTGDNILSVLRKTLFLLCLGQVNYVFVLNVTIFSLGIYCVKVLVFGWKIMLRNIVFFCVFQRCKKHKFYFKE